MAELLQLIVNGLITGSVIAIAAIGLSLVYGLLRIVNFAHGDYLTLGAFVAFTVNASWSQSIVLGALAAIAVVGTFGFALELGLWRPMRNKGAGVLSLLLTSVGLSFVMRQTMYFVWGAQPRTFNVNIYQTFMVGPLRFPVSQIPVIAIAFIAIVLVALMLARTRIGKAMRAFADDRQLASVAGIDIDRVALATWAIGSALAGLAGVMQGLIQSGFNPELGGAQLLLIFAAVILGGVGNAYGALVGGLALGVVMEVSTWSVLAGGVSPSYKPVIAFVVLIVALILRPQGLLGKATLT
jgi:neutral amino acid transport system permease protein